MQVLTDHKHVEALLERGVAECIGKESLREALLSGRRLRVKLGIDPTSPSLHLGRSVPLLKLRDFQELGHQVVLIIGDFTGVIGDTSDKDAERPMLSGDTIERNKAQYFSQAGKLIDLERAECRYNSEWLSGLTYREIGEHADRFSVSDFIARENIKKRLAAGKRVSLREVLYPLMQGYDSVAVKADVELGGTDQRFNLLAGRTLQEAHGQPPQHVLMNPLVPGLDGRKMSSSWGNTITLADAPEEMYGKVMSVHDDMVEQYFTLFTRLPSQEVNEALALHPKEAKMRLAEVLVAMYHGKKAAKEAGEAFKSVFGEGALPATMPEVRVAAGTPLMEALRVGKVVASNSEFRRLLAEGAVSLPTQGGKIITTAEFLVEEPLVVKVGKRRFVSLVIS